MWDSPLPAQPGGSGPGGPPNSRANHLADLFRPPYNLIERVTWDEARDLGKDEKRWLLVNLQNPADFHSQALNRDIWKDAAVVALVREHFVFLQYEKGHPAADQYVSFYFPDQAHERAETYPHVSIVDPRTGEQVKTWSGAPFPSAVDFHAQLVEFLDRYSLEANSKNPVVRAKRPEAPRKNIERMTEEEMFEMALQNSLHPNGGGGGGGGVGGASASFDPDALTKSPAESQTRAAEAQGDNDGDEETATAESAAFARIASNRPHVEPTADPATTTRIQVRHPEGRLIRRFALDERVARIYEWLKAAPLAGQEGVAFELKVVPQGHDLLADLERPIAEVDGLRNGTVAMEFV